MEIGTNHNSILAKIMTQSNQVRYVQYEMVKEICPELIVKFYQKSMLH